MTEPGAGTGPHYQAEASSVLGVRGDTTEARELFDRMKLGRYPDPCGDEFELFDAIAAEVQWPMVWAGAGLDPKTRALCTVAALIASGKPQVHGHIRGALAVGATRQELADVITHIAFYAGFPSAGNAKRAALEVFAELDDQSHREN